MLLPAGTVAAYGGQRTICPSRRSRSPNAWCAWFWNA